MHEHYKLREPSVTVNLYADVDISTPNSEDDISTQRTLTVAVASVTTGELYIIHVKWREASFLLIIQI